MDRRREKGEGVDLVGDTAAGSGTRLSNALEGLPLVYRTEEGEIQAIDLKLADRFSQILGLVR